MKKNTVILKGSALMLASVLLLSCSSGGGENTGGNERVQPSYSSLVYGPDYLTVSGEIIFEVNGDVGSSGFKTVQIDVDNFLISAGDCLISNFSVTPEALSYIDGSSQAVTVTVSFFDQCFENYLELTADQTVTEITTLPLGTPEIEHTTQSLDFALSIIDVDGGTDVLDVLGEFVPESIYPDQDSFTVSAETYNPEAWNYNGVAVPITLQAADHFNNPVSDGTMIYFTTEGGSITSTCMTIDGACTVTWTSMSPRPTGGRVTILATAIGSESFIDTNGNGLFDVGSPYTDLPEVFRDDNENGQFDSGVEQFFDLDDNLTYNSSGNGMFNGPLCTASAESSGLCVKTPVHVQDSLVLVMSTSWADIEFSTDSVDLFTSPYETVMVSVADQHGNSMPMGTIVKISASEGEIEGTEQGRDYLEYEIQNSNLAQARLFAVGLKSNIDNTDAPDVLGYGTLNVKITTPAGNITEASIPITDID